MVALGHPDVRDLAGSLDVRQDTRLAGLYLPRVAIAPLGVPRGCPPSAAVAYTCDLIQAHFHVSVIQL